MLSGSYFLNADVRRLSVSLLLNVNAISGVYTLLFLDLNWFNTKHPLMNINREDMYKMLLKRVHCIQNFILKQYIFFIDASLRTVLYTGYVVSGLAWYMFTKIKMTVGTFSQMYVQAFAWHELSFFIIGIFFDVWCQKMVQWCTKWTWIILRT